MKAILNKFNFKGEVITVVENAIGLINTTYLVTSNTERYILQKINNSVFNNPKELMENINLTTSFLKRIGHKTLDIIKSNKGKLYVVHRGEYWRAFKYIEGMTFQKVDNIKIVSESASELARFHRDLKSFPIHNLHNIIPDFHNTVIIFKIFQDVLLNCPKHLSDKCIEQINYILRKEKDCQIIQELLVQHKIPLLVCHNDPKISNVLFDFKLNAICLIDLDTLMPGTLLTDIADAVRTMCVSETEDESDLSKLYFKYDYFENFLKSYLKVNKINLNYYELSNIVKSIELIFLEQGMRFLTDYLNGNCYFKVSYKNQNLVRAKNQLYLSEKVAKNNKKLDAIVKQYTK
jgi:thiamine kinase-like enzyme